jgi:IMP dehydrogenase/GMP reductase
MAHLVEPLHGGTALTFDDVLLLPGHSQVLPGEADVATRLTRTLSLNIPIISSAMDTVTEARLAIAMAQAGGIGTIHRNFDPEAQAEQVRQVKKFESGMVVNPITIGPGRDACRRIGADETSPHFRHSRHRGRRHGRAWEFGGGVGRHSHQPRRALCL